MEDFEDLAARDGIEAPPLGPPDTATYAELPPEWYRGDEVEIFDLVDLWERHVTEDACEICAEIEFRSLSEIARAAIRVEGREHCVECYATTKICRQCRRCPDHAGGHCEDVTTRWSKVRRRREELWYEDHDWFEVPA